jgi:Flp pilus assembly pilin Flp
MDQVRRALPVLKDAGWRLAGEEGQGLVEYCLVLLLVAVGLVGALSTFGSGLNVQYQSIVSAFPSF